MPTQEPAAHGPASGSGVRGDTYEAAAATGESLAAPGESVAAPGKSVAAPGKSVAAPGKSVAAPGESVAAPGKSVVAPDGTAADAGQAAAAPGEIRAAPGSSADGPGGSPTRRLAGAAAAWASVFAASLGLFTVRFLVPVPVGLADNHDGPRLMCGLGVGPVTGGHLRYFKYAYFKFHRDPACAGVSLYLSSQHLLLDAARWLTPVLGLPGTVNLIALGLLTSAIAAFGIASLTSGLRLPLWARLLVAAAVWLIMADAAFFPTFASPFSEGATLVGLLLVAAGAVYLGRGWPGLTFGLLLVGSGSVLAILSKEQYVTLVVPICLTTVLASAVRDSRPGSRRFLTRQTGAAAVLAAALVVMTAIFVYWDRESQYAATLHHEQAVDVIFQDIVNGHDNARADLQALGLPASWAKYAGTDAFTKVNPRGDPLFHRYAGRLTEGTIVRFLLTHPSRILSIGQLSATFAMDFRVTYLGNFAPGSGHRPGALEHRVQVVSWLVRRIPARFGLWWLVPLWAVMAAIAIGALRAERRSARQGPAAPRDARRPAPRDGNEVTPSDRAASQVSGSWRRDAAVLVLCMTGCAIAAFIPAAYFDGISTTRHMIGMNLSTALAVPLSVTLALSMLIRAVPWFGRHAGADTEAVPTPDSRGSAQSVPGLEM